MKEKLEFQNPKIVLENLKRIHDCHRVHQIKAKLKGANNKADRERFFGALFAESLNKITNHEYLVRIPEEDEDRDCEILDYTEFQSNQQLPKESRNPDHFLLQNVQITGHVITSAIKEGGNNIYKIFIEHLNRTKLSKKAGDYSGCILVFYIGLSIQGKLDLRKIRGVIRCSNQSKFKQIWVVIPNNGEYGIAELCHSEDHLTIASFDD